MLKEIVNVCLDSKFYQSKHQRSLDMKWVKQRVGEFDKNALDIIHLKRVIDGYVVIDGQHRIELAKLAGENFINAYVYYALSDKEEADLYKKIEDKKKRSPINDFWVDVIREDEQTLDILSIVTDCGFKISRSEKGSSTVYHISAVKTLYRTYERTGRETLIQSLELIGKSFNGDCKSLSSSIIEGVSIFCKMFYNNTFFSTQRFLHSIGSVPIYQIKNIAAGKHIQYGNAGYSMFYTILELYNKGLKKNKLVIPKSTALKGIDK